MNDLAKTFDDAAVHAAGQALGRALQALGLMAVTAESCTGGLVAVALTETAGSSAWFERGFVTYTNTAKHQSLGVPLAMLEAHGAVSEPVAREMALGALRHSGAQVAMAVTGIAGPSDTRQAGRHGLLRMGDPVAGAARRRAAGLGPDTSFRGRPGGGEASVGHSCAERNVASAGRRACRSAACGVITAGSGVML